MKLRALPGVIAFIWNHPLNRHMRAKAMLRFFKWQIGSRLVPGPVVIDFAGSARLLARPGIGSATAAIYARLYEFKDMAFMLHCLQAGDRFLDIGANIGSYTILASVITQARCIAVEPVPVTFAMLCDNVRINNVADQVSCLNIGVGDEPGSLKFTKGFGEANHVAGDQDEGNTVAVMVNTMDGIGAHFSPHLIKIDVEGFETAVIAGGRTVLESRDLCGVIMETNGLGSRYGFDEAALRRKMLDYGFGIFDYDPFKRQLLPAQTRSTGSKNLLYVRNLDAVNQRLHSSPRIPVNGLQI